MAVTRRMVDELRPRKQVPRPPTIPGQESFIDPTTRRCGSCSKVYQPLTLIDDHGACERCRPRVERQIARILAKGYPHTDRWSDNADGTPLPF